MEKYIVGFRSSYNIARIMHSVSAFTSLDSWTMKLLSEFGGFLCTPQFVKLLPIAQKLDLYQSGLCKACTGKAPLAGSLYSIKITCILVTYEDGIR